MSEPDRRQIGRTIFFGSGGFAIPVLEALLDAPETEVVLVVATPDRPAGRHGTLTPSPLAARALELGLPLVRPPSLRAPEATAPLAGVGPDLGVLADYGRLVPPAILDLFPRRILNLHPSLLPRYRGATPIPAAILAGDEETGVSLIVLVAELDAGPIVAVERLAIEPDDTAPALEARAARAAGQLLGHSLGPWLTGELEARPQDPADASMTRPLRRDDGRIDPTRPAAHLERQVRAYQPWPGSFVETSLGRLVVWRATVEAAQGERPGLLAADDRGLALTVSDGRLRLLEAQLAGGRRMPADAILRGRPGLAGPLRG